MATAANRMARRPGRPRKPRGAWGWRLEGLMRERAWGVAELAAALRLSYRSVQRLLAGRGVPSGPAQVVIEALESPVRAELRRVRPAATEAPKER